MINRAQSSTINYAHTIMINHPHTIVSNHAYTYVHKVYDQLDVHTCTHSPMMHALTPLSDDRLWTTPTHTIMANYARTDDQSSTHYCDRSCTHLRTHGLRPIICSHLQTLSDDARTCFAIG